MKLSIRCTFVLGSLCVSNLVGACSDTGGNSDTTAGGGVDGVLGENASPSSTGGTNSVASTGEVSGGAPGTVTSGSGGSVATGGSASVQTGGGGATATGGTANVGTTTGGTPSATGGLGNASGGISSATGGAQTTSGGATSGGSVGISTGGIEIGTGGVDGSTGGSGESGGGSVDTGSSIGSTGGHESGTGGSNVGSGGTEPGTGGTEASTGGTGTDTGGSSTGGTEPGVDGGGGSSTCTITADYETSSAMPTVGIVTFSATETVTGAHIEFGLDGSSDRMEAPVDLDEPDYRTLLLGMKQNSDYVFRVVAETGSGTCTSEDYSLQTGAITGAPTVTVTGSGGNKGFIVAAPGMAGMGGGGFPMGGGGGSSMAFIFDTDGDVVWAAAAPSQASEAHMSWDGKDMWTATLNVNGSTSSGEVRRISMDGLDVQNNVSGLSGVHHDFTVTPNGIAAIVFNNSGCSAIVERSKDGTIETIVADVGTIYTPVGDCHTNYIRYYESDDSFTLSDRNPNLFVKISHSGSLIWQFGGTSPKGAAFQVGESWQVNHGHDLSEDGKFVFFNNGSGASAKVMEFQLNEASMSSSKLWTYDATSSGTLGNVQRLPGGNYLVVSSNSGKIDELDSAQRTVRSYSTSSLGYAAYRETLYGPPRHY